MSNHDLNFTLTTTDDLSNHIDRLNQALEGVMKEIEASSCSRNASRLSIVNSELITEDFSESSEESQAIYDNTIERLLQTIDRQQMVIEDLFSEEKRRISLPEPKERTCGHDLNKIRKEVWLQVKMQKNEQNERERRKFEEKLEALDDLQADYIHKRKELASGIETLKVKERLLNEKEKLVNDKEKEVRNQRLWMDKLKSELENGKSKEVSHSRRSSYSYLPDVEENKTVEESKSSESSKQEQIKNLQNEIRVLEDRKKKCTGEEGYELEIKIESFKGKIAGLRSEIAISESCKATRIMSSMMNSIKSEVNRVERNTRIQLIEAANKNLNFAKPKQEQIKSSVELKPEPKPKEVKVIEYGAPVPKGFIEPIQNKVSSLKEFCSQAEVIKLPGAKELIENVNLTLNTLNNERIMFDKEKEEFTKEKIEWIRNKDRIYARNRLV